LPPEKALKMSELIRVTAARYMEIVRKAQDLVWGAFPEFAYHNAVVDAYWRELYDSFAKYQFALLDPETRVPLALGNCFPISWHEPLENLPEEGFEWALKTGVEQFRAGERPNMLSTFQIVTSGEARGRGLSYRAVEAMIGITRENNLATLIAPVRPNRKSDHPAISIDEYTRWKRDDGMPFDDWIRVHVKLGGRIIKVCHKSYLVTGSIADWQKWTGMTFPESGIYIIPGALVPVDINLESDVGTYLEPNVWMAHAAV
jgi:hypothetical protein